MARFTQILQRMDQKNRAKEELRPTEFELKVYE